MDPELEQIVKASKDILAAAGEAKEREKQIAKDLEVQKADIAKYGQTTDETAARIKKAEEGWDQAKADVAGLKETNSKYLARLDELELKSQRGALGFGAGLSDDEKEAMKSLGERTIETVTANIDQFRTALQKGGQLVRDLPRIEGRSFGANSAFSNGSQSVQKALSLGESLNFIRPEWRPGILPMGARRNRMRDIIPVIPTSAPNVAYLRMRGFGPATELSVSGITSSGTTATATTASAHGYSVGDFAQVKGALVASFSGRKKILTVPTTTTFTYAIPDLSNASATGTITVFKGNAFGAAAPVAEFGTKPEAQMVFDEIITPLQVIAHFMKASRQVLDDAPQLRNFIDTWLSYGVLRAEDRYILYGTGTAPQLQGVMTVAGTNTYNWSDGPVGSKDTKIDAVRRAMTIVQLAEEEDPSGLVINPSDWEDIELTKNDFNQYILVNSPQPGTDGMSNPRIWRMPLVVTPAIAAGSGVMAPWAQVTALRDRQSVNVRFADQNDTDFIKNQVTILAEERVAMEIYRPEAITIVNFDVAPADA